MGRTPHPQREDDSDRSADDADGQDETARTVEALDEALEAERCLAGATRRRTDLENGRLRTERHQEEAEQDEGYAPGNERHTAHKPHRIGDVESLRVTAAVLQ